MVDVHLPADLTHFGRLIRLGAFATGGAGTSASPYTGWEAPLAAELAAIPNAVVLVDAVFRVTTAVQLPATGNYRFWSPAAGTVYDYNAGGSPPAFVTSSNVAGQPATSGQAAKANYLFLANPGAGQNKLNVVFEGILFYALVGSNRPHAILYRNGGLHSLVVRNCVVWGMGFYLNDGGGAPSQMNACWIEGNQGLGCWIYDKRPPMVGEITGNVILMGRINGTGFQQPPLPHAQFLEAIEFWTWHIAHNFFSYQDAGAADVAGAVLYYSDVFQTQDGSIHDNCFYGSEDAAIYVKSSWVDTLTNPEAGLQIHDNQFVSWNTKDHASAFGAAIVIDTPGEAAACNVQIGPNQYHGGNYQNVGPAGNHSKYGLIINGDPTSYGTSIDPHQMMEFITVAPVRINGVDYGGPIADTARLYRFSFPLAAPDVPASTVALVNPFAFDADVYVAGGTVTAIALDGVAVGITAGLVRVPVGSSIALTYSVAPTWHWHGS